jgi:hypothetical protein
VGEGMSSYMVYKVSTRYRIIIFLTVVVSLPDKAGKATYIYLISLILTVSGTVP